MTKFYKYINEKSNLDDFDLEEFKNDCYPFLKLLKKNNYHFLYSGRKSNESVFKKKVRKNRIPKDTPTELHNLLDEEFKNKFGVKARSQSLFTHTEMIRTVAYGKTFYVFPVGKNYDLIWNENVVDLFSNFGEIISKRLKEKIPPSEKHYFIVMLSDLIDKFKRSDYLIYNENLNRFVLPDYKSLPSSPKKVKEVIKLKKEEFYDIVNHEISNVVAGYKKGKVIKNKIDNEVMVVADYVWFVDKEMINRQDLRWWINENIR